MSSVARHDESIAELTRQGLSAREIAQRLGVTERTVTRSRRRTGTSLAPAECRPRYTPEFLALVEERLAEGWSLVEIARTYRVSEANIGKKFHGRGWTKAQASELAVMRKAEHRLFRTHADQRRGVIRQASVADELCRSGQPIETAASQLHTEAPSNAHRAAQPVAA